MPIDLKLIPKAEKKELFNFYLYPETLRQLREIAEKENVKISYLIRHSINCFISEYTEAK